MDGISWLDNFTLDDHAHEFGDGRRAVGRSIKAPVSNVVGGKFCRTIGAPGVHLDIPALGYPAVRHQAMILVWPVVVKILAREIVPDFVGHELYGRDAIWIG